MPMIWKEERGELIFTVSGEVDHHGAKGLMQQIDSALERNISRCLVMDLSGVSFMDSSGIALLLRAHRRAREVGGSLRVTGIPEQAMKVLRSAGLHKLMTLEG